MINSISNFFTGCKHSYSNRRIRKSSVLKLVILFTMFLHMPFVFAIPMISGTSKFEVSALHAVIEKPDGKKAISTISWMDGNTIALAYDSMHLDKLGLSEQAFDHAMKGFSYLLRKGSIVKDNIISIVDFSLPSNRKRLFVIDLDNYRVLYNTYVAHGVNSGKEYAKDFSNKPSSYKSSLGFYETRNTYIGEHGYSLRLNGLEKGINDNANSRDIVIHAADYVNESLIRSQGYIGRSWGCPALPEKLNKPIIDKIKNGSCLFIYCKNNAYQKKSRIINP